MEREEEKWGSIKWVVILGIIAALVISGALTGIVLQILGVISMGVGSLIMAIPLLKKEDVRIGIDSVECLQAALEGKPYFWSDKKLFWMGAALLILGLFYIIFGLTGFRFSCISVHLPTLSPSKE